MYEARDGTYAYATTYVYDGNGNRLRKLEGVAGAVTSYSYNVADELLRVQPPAGPPTTFLWDANGNQAEENTGGDRTTYTWDWENRLSRLQQPGGSVETYAYQENGYRVLRATQNSSTSFLWDQDNLLQDRRLDAGIEAHYTDLPGYWGGLSSVFGGGSSRFYASDVNQSNVLLLNSATNVVGSCLLTSFGVQILSVGERLDPYSYIGILGYSSDNDMRSYVRARYMAVNLGRWISRDPLNTPPAQSLRAGIGRQSPDHPYLYASGNPLRFQDPTGLHGVTIANCSNWQKMRIEQAMKHICRRACCAQAAYESSSDAFGGAVGNCYSGICDGSTTMTIRCTGNGSFHCARPFGGGKPCAITGRKGPMYLCDRFWEERGCPPLHCTIVHEIVHACGTMHTGADQRISAVLKCYPDCTTASSSSHNQAR